jgi:preprotein translocase subunit SecG
LAGTSDLSVRADISSGSEVLKLTDSSNIYVVPAGGKTTVNLQVTIPSGVKVGKTYNAKIDFTDIVSGAGGTALGTSIGQSFDIVVVGGGKSSSDISIIPYILIILIVLLILILAIIKLKKKKKIKSSKHKKRK